MQNLGQDLEKVLLRQATSSLASRKAVPGQNWDEICQVQSKRKQIQSHMALGDRTQLQHVLSVHCTKSCTFSSLLCSMLQGAAEWDRLCHLVP